MYIYTQACLYVCPSWYVRITLSQQVSACMYIYYVCRYIEADDNLYIHVILSQQATVCPCSLYTIHAGIHNTFTLKKTALCFYFRQKKQQNQSS
jgi:hypothetical protein